MDAGTASSEGGVWRLAPAPTLVLLTALLVAALVMAAGIGAVALSPGQVVAALLHPLGVDLGWPVGEREKAILWTIRLPRVALAMIVGAGLASAGAALQGAVRNPLADPGLLGVSSGAALAAVAHLVFGAPLTAAWPALAPHFLPAAAFSGGFATTWLVLWISRVDGHTSSVALVLGGVALGALAAAGTGLLIHIANDAQLRSITFWTLGSLGAASWQILAVVAPVVGLAIALLLRDAAELDRLLLGETEARHVGVDVDHVLRRLVLAIALAVGVSVAVCGVISFVGLVVPHIARGWLGPGHRTLIPAAALGGALLLLLADLAARTLVAPAELPVGVMTALVGSPVLILLVRRGRGRDVVP